MVDKSHADCEGGSCGETRLIRILGEGVSDDDLALLAPDIVSEIVGALAGLDDVRGLPQSQLEQGAIFAVSAALDFVLADLNMLPRQLTFDLYHILEAQEFNSHLGVGVSGAVRRGHAYIRRATSNEEMLTRFLRCLCHETVHLSAAIVVEVERVTVSRVKAVRFRSGLAVIEDRNYFRGLDEAVTDRTSRLIQSATHDLLGIGGGVTDQLPKVESVYETHEAVVDGICRRLYRESNGEDGWHQLMLDHWGGTNNWLDLVHDAWPAAYYALRIMDETPFSAKFTQRFLGLK